MTIPVILKASMKSGGKLTKIPSQTSPISRSTSTSMDPEGGRLVDSCMTVKSVWRWELIYIFLFFLSEEDIIGSQYCLEPGAASLPCPSFTRKKNLDKQSYCRNLSQSPSVLRSQIEIGTKIQLQLWREATIGQNCVSVSLCLQPWVPPYLNCRGWGGRRSAG